MKNFKPIRVLSAWNSRVQGIGVDRDGNIRRLKVEYHFSPRDNVPVLTAPIPPPVGQLCDK